MMSNVVVGISIFLQSNIGEKEMKIMLYFFKTSKLNF